MLNGTSYGSPLMGRLKLGADRIRDSIDAVFMIPLNYSDDPACVWISYSIASLSLPRGSFAITSLTHFYDLFFHLRVGIVCRKVFADTIYGDF